MAERRTLIESEQRYFDSLNLPPHAGMFCGHPGWCGFHQCDRLATWRLLMDYSSGDYVDEHPSPLWFCDDHLPFGEDDGEIVERVRL